MLFDIKRRVIGWTWNFCINYSLFSIGNEKKMRNIIIIILDFGEFLIAISITAQQDPKKKLEWAFSMYGKYFSILCLFLIHI
jgi:hypothetical protein